MDVEHMDVENLLYTFSHLIVPPVPSRDEELKVRVVK
jgi:hypothetical protein